MPNDLEDRVARAMAVPDKMGDRYEHLLPHARAAIAAIEAAGHVVVPREPTPDMRIRGGIAWAKAYTTYPDAAGACFHAMIQAALEKDKANVG